MQRSLFLVLLAGLSVALSLKSYSASAETFYCAGGGTVELGTYSKIVPMAVHLDTVAKTMRLGLDGWDHAEGPYRPNTQTGVATFRISGRAPEHEDPVTYSGSMGMRQGDGDLLTLDMNLTISSSERDGGHVMRFKSKLLICTRP
jgi:hypothetical protein